jgi:hypothetical protein
LRGTGGAGFCLPNDRAEHFTQNAFDDGGFAD